MNEPIKPVAHGAIDYAFLAMYLSASTLIGLEGAARNSPTSSAAPRALRTPLPT